MATVPSFDGSPAPRWPVAVPAPQGPPAAFDPGVWRTGDYEELSRMAAERKRQEVFSRFAGSQFEPMPSNMSRAVNVPPPQVRGEPMFSRPPYPGYTGPKAVPPPSGPPPPTPVVPPRPQVPQPRPVGFNTPQSSVPLNANMTDDIARIQNKANMTPRGIAGTTRVNTPGAYANLFAPNAPAAAAGGARITVPGSGALASIGNRQMPGLGWGGVPKANVLSATGASSIPRVIPGAGTPGGSSVARFFNGTKTGRLARGFGLPMAIGTALGYAQDPIVDALGGDSSNAGQIADSAIGGARLGLFAGPVGGAIGGLGAGAGQAGSELIEAFTGEKESLPNLLSNSDNVVGELVGGLMGGSNRTALPISAEDIRAVQAGQAAADPEMFRNEFMQLGLDPSTANEVWDEYNQSVQLQMAMYDADPAGWKAQQGWPEDAADPTEEDIRRSLYSQTLQAVPEIIAATTAEKEQRDRAAAFQMATAEWMQPYEDAAYQRADATRQMMASVIPNMPAQYQPVASMYAEQAALGAEAMADAYGASARMIPQLSALEAYLSMPPPQQEEPAAEIDAETLAMMEAMGAGS